MSRLIDADKLKHVIHCAYSDDLEILEKIDEQPTAFDVDKVVEQIENIRANFDCKLCKYNDDENTICSEDCSDALIDILLEIVKGGGIK
jgi:hypothetical protein